MRKTGQKQNETSKQSSTIYQERDILLTLQDLIPAERIKASEEIGQTEAELEKAQKEAKDRGSKKVKIQEKRMASRIKYWDDKSAFDHDLASLMKVGNNIDLTEAATSQLDVMAQTGLSKAVIIGAADTISQITNGVSGGRTT